jgi:hypothetical protein
MGELVIPKTDDHDCGLETKGYLEIRDVVVDSLRDADHAKFKSAPPPVDTWMMPSLLLSASPLSTAFALLSDVTLMAG